MIITLQFADRVDHITPDGQELTQRPYPYHVAARTGLVQRQDFWVGRVYQVMGFTDAPDRMVVDLLWADAAADPQKAVGKYVVVADDQGNMFTNVIAIMSATAVKVDLDPEVALERARMLVSRIEQAEDAETLNQLGAELADVIQALDEHLTEGGFPPKAWLRD